MAADFDLIPQASTFAGGPPSLLDVLAPESGGGDATGKNAEVATVATIMKNLSPLVLQHLIQNRRKRVFG